MSTVIPFFWFLVVKNEKNEKNIYISFSRHWDRKSKFCFGHFFTHLISLRLQKVLNSQLIPILQNNSGCEHSYSFFWFLVVKNEKNEKNIYIPFSRLSDRKSKFCLGHIFTHLISLCLQKVLNSQLLPLLQNNSGYERSYSVFFWF